MTGHQKYVNLPTMLLSGYNKFIFSIISEAKDYLVLKVYFLKFGKSYISFLQIHYTRTDDHGKYLPSFVFNTRLKVIECNDREINFSRGRIFFTDDSVKIEFSFEMLMFYINYTLDKNVLNPINILGKTDIPDSPFEWNSFCYKSPVKCNLVTPNFKADFINAPGNIDLIRSKKIPLGINALLWSRLHNNEIDMTFSFIINGSLKSDSRFILLHENKLIQFSDVEYHVISKKVSEGLSVKYPDNILLTASNGEYEVSVKIQEHSEAGINEMVNSIDFAGKLLSVLLRRLSGNPRELKLHAKADIIIRNNISHQKFTGVTSISEYICFAR